ncbi:hypothetical protein O3P69_020724 [Scylla paramamosain]|uniref:Major facilitator superfamily (MFS) profile domain-containing protein n=1 Tax=Scylla paramamosain TaxID=85552 RepID=A0AAW0TNN8_SCYPA
MVTRLGRRRSMQTVVAPWLIGLVALALAPNAYILLVARLLLGFTSGVSAVAGSLYVTEVVDAEVRGVMYNILCLNVTLGGLFTVGVGYLVRWYHLAVAGYPLDADIGTITVAAARLVGMLMSFFLVDRMGRRVSLVASHAFTSAFLIVLGVYVHLAPTAAPEDTTFSTLALVPLVSIIMIVFGLQLGAQPVAFLLSAEYFPTRVRGQTLEAKEDKPKPLEAKMLARGGRRTEAAAWDPAASLKAAGTAVCESRAKDTALLFLAVAPSTQCEQNN